MKQASIIFAAILFAFVVYITVRGQLPEYIAIFTGSTATPATNSKAETDSVSKAFGNGASIIPQNLKDKVNSLLKSIGMNA